VRINRSRHVGVAYHDKSTKKAALYCERKLIAFGEGINGNVARAINIPPTGRDVLVRGATPAGVQVRRADAIVILAEWYLANSVWRKIGGSYLNPRHRTKYLKLLALPRGLEPLFSP
jgi:hypothetical protein